MERTVHLVDDDDALRQALSERLEGTGLKVSAHARPGTFLDAAPDLPSGHVVLSDIFMPEMTGLEMLDQMNAIGARQPVVFMTGFGDIPLAVEAMNRGAITFLEKPVTARALDDALKMAFEAVDADGIGARLETLSEREREVLEAGAAGTSVKQTGLDLGISYRTVEHHRVAVRQKLGVESFSQAVQAFRGFTADA